MRLNGTGQWNLGTFNETINAVDIRVAPLASSSIIGTGTLTTNNTITLERSVRRLPRARPRSPRICNLGGGNPRTINVNDSAGLADLVRQRRHRPTATCRRTAADGWRSRATATRGRGNVIVNGGELRRPERQCAWATRPGTTTMNNDLSLLIDGVFTRRADRTTQHAPASAAKAQSARSPATTPGPAAITLAGNATIGVNAGRRWTSNAAHRERRQRRHQAAARHAGSIPAALANTYTGRDHRLRRHAAAEQDRRHATPSPGN